MERSEQILVAYAKKHGARDHFHVLRKSTELIMNLFVKKTKYDTQNALTMYTIRGVYKVCV